MCTSFIHRGAKTTLAMNFDNNGMGYKITDKYPGWFVVLVDGGYGFLPSFGVSRKGEFFNSLLVNSNGKGLYKRPSQKSTHTSKLIADLLEAKLNFDDLSTYLEKVEVVNTPNYSCHNFICDRHANTWIVEPGRENLYFDNQAYDFNVMTNVSIVDVKNGEAAMTCPRYIKTSEALTSINELTLEAAFEILSSVSQSEGDWTTALSLVYVKSEETVYYCYNRDFNKILKCKLG